MPLHLYRFGPDGGTPLVALHGLKGYGGRWRQLAGRLGDVRVYAPDLRGHGWSAPQPPWTVNQHAEDVLAVLDDLGLPRVDVLGHSLGGTVAIELARLAPERVGRLVLLDPVRAVPPDVALQRALAEFAPPSFADPGEAATARAQHWPAGADGLVADEVREHLACDGDGRWRWRYVPAAAVTGHSEAARPLVFPPRNTATLLVLATRDVPGGHAAAAWREALGPSSIVVEMDCGHQIYLERPAETATMVADFLGAVSG
jgi:lipase